MDCRESQRSFAKGKNYSSLIDLKKKKSKVLAQLFGIQTTFDAISRLRNRKIITETTHILV